MAGGIAGCTPYNGLYVEAPLKHGYMLRVGIWVGKSVISVFKREQNG